MRVRSILAAAAACASAVLLAGCSGAASTGGGGGGGNGNQTITWWQVQPSSPDATKALKTIITDFEKANPKIKVNLQFKGVDALKQALLTTAGSGAGPDIYYNWTGPGLGGELVKDNVSLDMTKYYTQYKWASRYNASTLKGVTQYGGYHGIPWTQHTEVVYYHKDMFAKSGITAPPTTYAEWVADAQKLKDHGYTPMSMGGKDNWHVMRLLDTLIETNCGATLGDQLNTRKASWSNQPCVTKSFDELKTWADKYFNKGFAGISQSQAADLFTSNKSAMEIEGDWFTSQITASGDKISNVGIFAMPTGTGRLYGFGEAEYIDKQSKHADAAAKFLNYFTSAEVEGKYLGTFAAVPVNTMTKPATTQQPLNVQIAALSKAAKGYFLNNDQNFPTDVTTEYWRIQNGVTGGSINANDSGSELQKFIGSHK